MSDGEAGTNIGERLAAARAELGLGEEDVADALNLSARVIEDLENEAWQALPAPAFTRGYIRAYAKLLEIDSEALVHCYERIAGMSDTVELEVRAAGTAPSAGVGEMLQRQPGTVLSGAVIVGVAVVVVIVWAVWPGSEAERGRIDAARTAELVRAESAQRSEPVRETVAETAAKPVAETETLPEIELAGAVADPETSQPGEVAAASVEPETDDPIPSTARADVEPTAGTERVQRLTATGDDRLRLAFNADCWVEVKDESNTNLFSDLGRAGDLLELVGASPFRILLGYAPGVVLEYNGERVSLAGYTRNNVAALWLGRRT